VNVANRVEQLGKEFMRGGEDVVLLVSGDTLANVKDRESLNLRLPEPELRPIKGHEEPLEVYRLV